MKDILNEMNKSIKIDLRTNEPLDWAVAAPVHAISLDLTQSCNLACDYCFTHMLKDGYAPTDLSEENAYKVIDWLIDPKTRGDNKKIDITFWGGEPLMKWPLMQKIVLYANEKGKEAGVVFTYGMTTNITLLTKEKFAFFREHNIDFLLSMDGTKEHHDAHRPFKNGKGSFDTCDKNIEDILKEWPDAAVRISYTAEKIHEFMDDIMYFYNKGFRHIVYSPVLESDWTDEAKESLRVAFDKISDFYIEKHKAGERLIIKSIEDACRGIGITEKSDRSPCGAGRGYLCVTTDLSIYPCHRFNKFNDNRPWYEKEMCLGHVEHGLLNKKLKDKFDKWSIYEHMQAKCSECDNHGIYCHGGCWATNFDIEGDIAIVPELDCFINDLHRDLSNKLIALLGKRFESDTKRRNGIMENNENILPLVQGCTCYNVSDSLYGTFVEDNSTHYRCLCNMASYGTAPEVKNTCGCYNSSDSILTYHDRSGISCINYSKNPVKDAIEYISNIDYDSMSEEDIDAVFELQRMTISSINK